MADERKVKVVLQADIDGYRRAMAEADRATARAATDIDRHGNKITGTGARMVRSAEVNREAWQTAGTSLVAFGAVGVASLGLSAKAAVDWESAWTGVLKTVEGTPDELMALEESLRSMALRMPASAAEIAGVAEAAGQLGVKVKDVAAFTEVMVNLGETTNLTASEAATQMARFANVMGTASGDVDRLGSTLVDLGNNAATTEAEILAMASRLAAAGRQAGLSEADVFAFASTLSSVGVEAEAGGTAISKVFTSINDAVIDGGDKLDTFARIAGMSAADFRAAYETDAAGAIGSFIEGMGRLSASGESTTQVFDDLELTDQRLKRAILSTGSAAGLLADQVGIANTAWSENNALVEEARKRYESTEAKIAIARNAINEAAISLGENLLPLLASAAGGVASMAEAFANLPDSAQTAIAILGGVASVAALAGGAFLMFFPRILDTARAFRTLRAGGSPAPGVLGKITKAATLATAALAATSIGISIMNDRSVESAGVGEFTQALLDVADGASIADTALSALFDSGGASDWFNGNDIDSISAAFDRIANSSWDEKLADGINMVGSLGSSMAAAREQSQEIFDGIDKGLASLVQSGNAEAATRALEELAGQIGVSPDSLSEILPGYRDALAQADVEQKTLVESTEDLTDSTFDYNEVLTEQLDLMREAAGVTLDEREAVRNFQQALDDATASLEANGATVDNNTEKGRANQEALDDIASATWDWIEAGAAAGESAEELTDRMEAGREAFIKSAEQMGINRARAEALADELGLIPASVETAVKIAGSAEAKAAIDSLIAKINSVPTSRRTSFGIVSSGGFFSGGDAQWRASGGPISGPGTPTSDSIPIWASDGEYMQNAAAHRYWGTPLMDSLNRRDVFGVWKALSARGYATGGAISVAGGRTMSTPAAAPGSGISRADLLDFAHIIAAEFASGAADIADGRASSRARAASILDRMGAVI